MDDKELREKGLLTPEEIRAIPFYKLTPDFALPDSILKAQQDKDFALLQQKIEEARRQERAYIKSIGAKWPTKTVAQIIGVIEVNEQAIKGAP